MRARPWLTLLAAVSPLYGCDTKPNSELWGGVAPGEACQPQTTESTPSTNPTPALPTPTVPAAPPSAFDRCRAELTLLDPDVASPEVALERFARLLWDRDAQTLQDAQGPLPLTPAGNLAYATQAAQDVRAAAGFRAWALSWLHSEELPQSVGDDAGVGDGGLAPVDLPLITSLHEGALRLIVDVVARDGTLSTLMQSQNLFVNRDLGEFYGLAPGATPQTDEQWVQIDTVSHHRGLLTQGWIAARHKTPAARGAFLFPTLLNGAEVPFLNLHPPESLQFTPQAGESERDAWMRNLQQGGPSCVACHDVLDGPGFVLQHYDAQGHYRDTDEGGAIDSSGWAPADGMRVELSGADELAAWIGQSQTSRQVVALAMLDYLESETFSASSDALRNECKAGLAEWLAYPQVDPLTPGLRTLFVQLLTRSWLGVVIGVPQPEPPAVTQDPTPVTPPAVVPSGPGTSGAAGSSTACP